jgi:hypothetical protein
MRDYFTILGAGLFGLLAVGVVFFGLNAAGLLYMPFVVHQQTRIVHASQGYIESQQQMLRQWRGDFEAAQPAQKAAIIRQMRETADLIPNDVQPDIASFLAGHGE